ncbi:MAG: DNA primase regulatory subunit PriL [Methanimicrococcus sp.]|nr:DNA primase regulatory subunit PriL [Methanimicrococcus sp.]
MSPEELAHFPYLPEALEYAGELDFSIESLMTSIAFESTRRRGFQRLMEAFEGEVSKPSFENEKEVLAELLSYPYARILISCFNEAAFTRRYALAEAKAAHTLLKKIMDKDPAYVLNISKDFGITAFGKDEYIRIHFSDYIRYSISMRDISWKLINRPIEKGYVTVQRDEFVRLLQEAVRKNIESSLPIQNIPEDIQNSCSVQIAELTEKYNSQKKSTDDADFGEVEVNLFPPCILKAILNVREGVNLAHSMRFAMVSFLLNVGMSTDDVVGLFNVSPDFVEEKTRYQVVHIAENEYKTPACSTMQTYGNCVGRDNFCDKIKHPLGYYSFKKFIAAENAAAENTVVEDAANENDVVENNEVENDAAKNAVGGNDKKQPKSKE